MCILRWKKYILYEHYLVLIFLFVTGFLHKYNFKHSHFMAFFKIEIIERYK